MFKKGKYLLILTLLVIFMSIVIVDAQQVSTATKADLVDSLEGLKEAMSKKINYDIDITAQAFTDMKDYWRSKRLVDIFRPSLRILEDTLSLLAKAADIKSLSKDANAALNNSETLYQFLSTVMMVQDLQKVGKNLYWGLNGPNYVASIESMLEEAEATFVPPFGDNWQKYYKETIENYLYGTTEKIPIIIPRRSATAERKNIEFTKGALQVRSRIARTFKELIKEIESKELPEDFPVNEISIQVKGLTKQIHRSMSYSTDLEYKTNFQDHVKVKLGAVGEQYRAFGQVAGMVDKNLEIEQSVELLKFIESIGNAVLLYTITYKIPGAEEIKIAQKATVLSELTINSYINTFYSDSEKVFYMLPQEMILSMPTELSNMWMIADDINQYLHCFYQEIATLIITSPLKITPSSPYYVGDNIDAEFTITNKESIPITFSILTVGGRDPDNQVADFTHEQNITFKSSESYDYKGTLLLNKIGNYHFFCTYQTPDGDWNTSIDLGYGLTSEDRVENIVVEPREKPSQGLVRIEDFSVDLTNVERSKDTATLSFVITKINDTDSAPESLQVALIDDHTNEYFNSLIIDLEEAPEILNALPKGFTYIDKVEINIPKIAPIKVIKLGDIEIPFKDIIFNQPKFKQDFGSYNVKPGTIFDIGKYLKFNIEGPNAGVSGWTLAVTVKNDEYNPIEVGIRVGTQFADGQVRWGYGNNAEVPGAGHKTFRFQIVLSPLEDVVCWSQPIMLIIKCWGGGTKALKLLPLTYADFSPLPERIAYHDGQSVYVMNTNGTEMSRLFYGKNPTWSTDGSKIIFGEGNRLRVSTADGSAKSQFYVSGNAALPHGGLNPVYSPDGKKIAFQKSKCVENEKGYINCFFFIHTINVDGSNLACLHKGVCPSWSPNGSQIAFSYGDYVRRGSNLSFETYICVMNADGSGVTKLATLKTGKLAGPPTWSPDMTKLAFSCVNQIYVMNIDGSDINILARGRHPSWAPATKFVTGDSLK